MTINWQQKTDDYNNANNTYFSNSKRLLSSLLKKHTQQVVAQKLSVSVIAIRGEANRRGVDITRKKVPVIEKMRDYGLEKLSEMTTYEMAKAIGAPVRSIRSAINYYQLPYVSRRIIPKIANENGRIKQRRSERIDKHKHKFVSREYWGDDEPEKLCKTCNEKHPVEQFQPGSWQERLETCYACRDRQGRG